MRFYIYLSARASISGRECVAPCQLGLFAGHSVPPAMNLYLCCILTMNYPVDCMERKKFVEFLGALFIAFIFISSYLEFTNIGGSSAASANVSKAKNASPTVFSYGYSNSIVSGYGRVLDVNVTCNSSESANADANLTNSLNGLEANGSAENFIQTSNGYSVLLSGNYSDKAYRYITKTVNSSYLSCMSFSSSLNLLLPQKVNLTYSSGVGSGFQNISVAVPQKFRTYSIPVTFNGTNATYFRLKLLAELYQNATIANMSISLV